MRVGGSRLRDPGDDEPALSLNDGVLQNIHHEDMLAHAAWRALIVIGGIAW